MAGEFVEPLLQSKLRIPSVRETIVRRQGLLARLDLAARNRLTLISAPAGYGKSTLLSCWAKQCRWPVAWLALDERDNDPIRFAAYLGAALDRVWQLDPEKAGPLQVASGAALEAIVSILLERLEQAEGAIVLALDDYHVIRAPAIHKAMIYLLEHLPAQAHVVIATRTDPPFPLARYRMDGEVAELRLDDLRFSSEEVEAFLRQGWQLDLGAADIAALEARTEGWAAGLQMAALSLQGRSDASTFIQSFAGSHRFVLDYLLEEVISRQPEAVQAFLLKTSILERLCAPLCDALVAPEGEHSAFLSASSAESPASTLEYLDRCNLFLIPLDDYRCWYRYHHLFADLLRARLRNRTGEAGLAALHSRAAHWYEANGLPEEAIHHALAAQDWPQAVELIKAHQYNPESFKQGNPNQLLEWLQAMPQEVSLRDPQLSNGYGWALALTGALEPAERVLHAALAANRGDPDGMGDTMAGFAYVARNRTELALAASRAQEALALLPAENAWMRSVAAMILGQAHWAMEDLAACQAAMQMALDEAERSKGERTRATTLCYLGRLRALDLDFQQAESCWRKALPQGDPRLAPSGDIAYFDLAALCYERNDLDAAAAWLSKGFQANRTSRNPDIAQSGYRTLARLRLARGDPDGALEALQQADEAVQSAGLGPFARNLAAACRAQVALALGDLPSAEASAGRIEGETGLDAFHPIPRLVEAQLWLAKGDRAAAWQYLEGLGRSRVERPGWKLARLRVELLRCLAATDSEQARQRLLGCLQAAQPLGLVRPFVDLGAPMEALLRAGRLTMKGPVRGFAEALLACCASNGPAPAPFEAPPGLVEPLTERELAVLRGLAEGLSNREIAEGQYVAVSTVKSHLKSIFGKLGVESRGKAVRRAQELGIL